MDSDMGNDGFGGGMGDEVGDDATSTAATADTTDTTDTNEAGMVDFGNLGSSVSAAQGFQDVAATMDLDAANQAAAGPAPSSAGELDMSAANAAAGSGVAQEGQAVAGASPGTLDLGGSPSATIAAGPGSLDLGGVANESPGTLDLASSPEMIGGSPQQMSFTAATTLEDVSKMATYLGATFSLAAIAAAAAAAPGIGPGLAFGIGASASYGIAQVTNPATAAAFRDFTHDVTGVYSVGAQNTDLGFSFP